MLVLSRYRDEEIRIGDDIVITVIDIRGDKVRLGIEAPNNIPVHRQEVYDAIAREKKPTKPEPKPSSDNKKTTKQTVDTNPVVDPPGPKRSNRRYDD